VFVSCESLTDWKKRATITLPFASAASPFGKPGGGERAPSENIGFEKSTPVSMIPIFIPAPAWSSPPSADQKTGAPMAGFDASSVGKYSRIECTEAIPGSLASSVSDPAGTVRANPFKTVR